MWNKTKVTQLLGINYPIIQGPFGGRFSSAKLVAAVSNLGGMGSFGLNSYSPEEILKVNSTIQALTKKTYGLNLWVPQKSSSPKIFGQEQFEIVKTMFKPYFDALNVPLPETLPAAQAQNFDQQMEAILQASPPVMSFIFGVPPQEVIQELRKRQTVVIATATHPEEALLLEEAGVDIIVASGAQAGGHRAWFLPKNKGVLMDTSSLLTQTIAQVKTPIIAAGGITNGQEAFAALQAGASAVQIGTAFLATQESNAPDVHKHKLLQEVPQTNLSQTFTGRLGRVISNPLSLQNIPTDKLAPYPLQSTFLSPLRKVALEQHQHDYVGFWSGQFSIPLQHTSASSLFRSLIDEINNLNPIS
ncbi:nitronate monooxygenase [uncultured Microscilla sp.]|uniref:NAD(P)H-dependent flavin oxidoreductase n=1 Tax=uncultured Microscilla sp. TaxID=432653 RepID=UPI002610D3D2|nr:nitronate monooxygenase [uncultured Microscilla sp.]